MVVTLIQNAFFDAVLPGLEGKPKNEVKPAHHRQKATWSRVGAIHYNEEEL